MLSDDRNGSEPMTIGETLTRCNPQEHPRDGSNGVLVAEDDPMFRRILKSWVETWGYQVTVAEDGEKAWNILQQETQPELLILDWVMPGIDGAELCHRIRARQSTPYQYILLVTAKDDTEDVVAGLEAGADDYLIKPFERNELRARLRVGRRILLLQAGLIQAREDLRFQATHDALTGIWNRRALLDLLQREIERASRSQASTGLLMLDLDHFKQVNDTHGHLAGDAVLREVSLRITQVIRSYDLVGRHGGKEFLVVLPGCDPQQTLQSAERIRSAVAAQPVLVDHSEIYVTISVGATATTSNTSEKQILAIADTALYQAKNAGRNCTALL
jgi:two-component system, cell cycle response regulator